MPGSLLFLPRAYWNGKLQVLGRVSTAAAVKEKVLLVGPRAVTKAGFHDRKEDHNTDQVRIK